ncbi:succinate dehydrogenase, hydrophobic membrane anchor protein [Jannaschia sp. S6380]|uniref:succinate dehydrogenase, hydrophobic membrane anchor protein n=1 Tax=Jannaschia sp. S6380 TaxID=2926408 RepID=UPI001FF38B46|nr:succinate dehydrogenase, hydrophobic membrane anchor protein [Jannaschia sp. S6380]MCK0168146.1 succinate dehydrogenase, hydrophobic membrane anchor protein [Jannaschia sp. S6380]
MKSAAQTFLTDRKRVDLYGSAHTGTAQHWRVTISSVALVILVPLFVFTFGAALGEPWPEVVAYYSRPFPAIVAALTLAVGWWHFAKGVHVLITDYSRGMTRKVLIVVTHIISYAAAAACLYALARLAL